MKTINELIESADSCIIICHIRPDGDCLGAGFALSKLLRNKRKKVDFVCDSEMPAHYSFIKNSNYLNDINYFDYDLAISLDCADEFRLGKYSDNFFDCANTVNIDHHATNTCFGGLNIVDDSASSTCEILYYLFKNDPQFDSDIAENLYMGISTDTGHFRHDNTTAATFSAAAELINYDFDATCLINNLYRSNSMGKLKLIGLAINKLRYFCNNQVGLIALTQKDLSECNCLMSDTEGLIDYPMTVSDVKVAVCMSQQSPVSFKVSFRSKKIDVSKVAAKFGGGGHVLASGCVVNGDYNQCINKVITALSEELI